MTSHFPMFAPEPDRRLARQPVGERQGNSRDAPRRYPLPTNMRYIQKKHNNNAYEKS